MAMSAKLDQMRKPLLGQLTANFRTLKPMIEKLPLYQLIKSMPKGGLLHCHGIYDVWFAIQTATYFPTCYVDLRNSSRYGQSINQSFRSPRVSKIA
jgi:adenosine deaminase CECR1